MPPRYNNIVIFELLEGGVKHGQEMPQESKPPQHEEGLTSRTTVESIADVIH